jgi:hypothetical protein
MNQRRSMTREIGTAFAVLALYLLTVLAPLHQARATQLDFQALGYETLQTGWVLCTASETRKDSDRTLVSKCPASGIGKQHLAEPSPLVIDLGTVAVLVAEAGPAPRAIHPFAPLNRAAPPRAPPSLA